MAASVDPLAGISPDPTPLLSDKPGSKAQQEVSAGPTQDVSQAGRFKETGGQETGPTSTAGVATAFIDDSDHEEAQATGSGAEAVSDEIPSDKRLKKIEKYMVLDRHSKSHTFKSLYTGRNVARRVLIVFVRHFYCGNCQEYLRALAASITPDALLRLPISTFIAVVGCGDAGLIEMYTEATECPFPIYADPTGKLYSELGMVRTLAMGKRPAYTSKSLFVSSIASVFQGLKQVTNGLAMKGGDQKQNGGEFLFEPLNVMTPTDEVDRQMGKASRASTASPSANSANGDGSGNGNSDKPGNVDGPSSATQEYGKPATVPSLAPNPMPAEDDESIVEEKTVTWCHRMRSTRDHAEIPELMEILGLDGQGQPVKDKKRWSRALEMRKGTGLSMATQMSGMKANSKAPGT